MSKNTSSSLSSYYSSNAGSRGDNSMDSMYFSDPTNRRNVCTNPGDQGANARSQRECTIDNWGAEIDRRFVGNTSSRDFAYDKSDPKHTSAYLLPEKKR
ncbi:hypothetical protein RBB50_008117 [Rhinocladiella similis]